MKQYQSILQYSLGFVDSFEMELVSKTFYHDSKINKTYFVHQKQTLNWIGPLKCIREAIDRFDTFIHVNVQIYIYIYIYVYIYIYLYVCV